MKFTITKIAGHSASFEVDKNHKHVKNLLINVDTLLDSEVGRHGHEKPRHGHGHGFFEKS